MTGLGFISAGFLAAGAAGVALPVLIHLLLRRRAHVLEIGSVRFLQSVIRQHTRRRRIRQWLLLAMRMLAVLLLAALFARPFLDASRLRGLDREVVLLVDRSASMQARLPGGATALAAARKAAIEELDRLDENTAVRVALFDAGGVDEIGADRLRRTNVAGDAATDYVEAFRWARDVLTLSRRTERAVHLFTDLQQSGLDRGTLEGFSAGIEVSIHDVGRDTAQNLVVEDARAVAVEIRPKSSVTVAARLHNSGALPVRDVAVRLRLKGPAGQIDQHKTADLPAGARVSLDFPLDIPVAGLYLGQVSLEQDDDLPCDNRRHIAFEARHPDRILLVDGQQGTSVYTNETYYLETALRLRAPLADAPPRTYEIERIAWDDGKGFPDLAGFRALILANIGRFTSDDGRRLRHYVDAGGNLLIFSGDRITPAVVRALDEAGLFSARIAEQTEAGQLRVDAWQADHPVVALFADPQHGDLRRLVFDRVQPLDGLGDSARVLVRAGAYPLIVEQPVGHGIVLFVATTADRDWSDWPQTRLYVPLVRQMAAYLTGQLGERRRVRDEIVTAAAQRAGIDQAGELTVVRNIDPRESLLHRVSHQQFRDALDLPEQEEQSASTTATAAPPGAERPDEAWTSVVWVLLGVLFVETLLASRIHA